MSAALRRLDEVSYAAFLLHAFFLHLLVNAIPTLWGAKTLTATLQTTAVVVPVTLVAAWLSFKHVEKPLRARAREIAQRYEGGTDPPPLRAPVPALGARQPL